MNFEALLSFMLALFAFLLFLKMTLEAAHFLFKASVFTFLAILFMAYFFGVEMVTEVVPKVVSLALELLKALLRLTN